MKRLLCMSLVLAFLFAASVCLAEEIDLVGEWQGPIVIHSEERGFISADGTKGRVIIIEQKDGAFTGKNVWNRDGKDRSEGFSGVISPDGKTLFMAGHDDGYFIGEIIAPDEIVFYYLEDGAKAKAMRRQLKKVK